MPISLVPFEARDPADRQALVDFMATNRFPFHVQPHPSRENIEKRIATGNYSDADNQAYWLEEESLGRIGVVVLEDLSDDTPLFDLRLSETVRGQGLGLESLKAIAAHVFATMPAVHRFEGQTREDNIPMRRIFRSAGWVQEAYYRQAWPVGNGMPAMGSVAYSLLRQDWEHGTLTPIRWEME